MEKLLNWVIVISFLSFCMVGYAVYISPEQKLTYDEPEEISYVKLDYPLQLEYTGNKSIPYKRGEINVIMYPKAAYQVYAQVMSKKEYLEGWESEISKYDLALAWNKLMLPEYQKGIEYSQRDRFCHIQLENSFPLTNEFINTHSSNNHIIPANHYLEMAISRIKPGDKVFLQGFLVNVEGSVKDQTVWWNSSLSRDDEGDGACEILYVTRAFIDDVQYY